jgi:hypothetical protein
LGKPEDPFLSALDISWALSLKYHWKVSFKATLGFRWGQAQVFLWRLHVLFVWRRGMSECEHTKHNQRPWGIHASCR